MMANDVLRTVRGTPKHLSRIGQLESFTYLMINLPFVCNFRCKKCFNLDDGVPHDYANILSLDEQLSLIEQSRDLGGKAVVFAGEGEPNLDKNLEALLKKTHSIGLIPIVYSNGSTVTDELILLYKKTRASVVFAFDTLDSSVFSMKTRDNTMFAKTIINITKTIESLKENISYEGGMKIFGVAINMTINDLNMHDISKIKSLWNNDAYFICNPLAKLGNAIANWAILKGAGKYSDEEVAGAIERYSESGGPLTLGTDGFCGYSRWGIAVSPEGNFMTCAYTNKTDGLLGHVRTMSLKDAFNRKFVKEDEHYKTYGMSPCLVRHPNFDEYISKI
jgi:MoaA/NifB/PqqE/SkfB family radical SAM enzyme